MKPKPLLRPVSTSVMIFGGADGSDLLENVPKQVGCSREWKVAEIKCGHVQTAFQFDSGHTRLISLKRESRKCGKSTGPVGL